MLQDWLHTDRSNTRIKKFVQPDLRYVTTWLRCPGVKGPQEASRARHLECGGPYTDHQLGAHHLFSGAKSTPPGDNQS